MELKQISAIAIILTAATSATAACRHEKEFNHVFPADAFKSTTIRALAGRLDVESNNDGKVVFRGVACADEEEYLERISLDIQDSVDNLELTVVIPYRERDFDAEYAFMDVEITLPRDLPIAIFDSSGDIYVDDVSVTSIDDSSGNIYVSRGRTDLSVEDSSGDVDIRELGGNMTIVDSSGDITIRDVKGEVMIPRDSSGDIEVDQVTGMVTVERDSSGEIEIENVGREVIVGSDGSGSIDISHVKGNVSIGSDGSGRVRVSNVSGDFELNRKGSGDIRVRDVEGKVTTPR